VNETALFLHLRSLDKSQCPADEREAKSVRDAIIGDKLPLVTSVVRRVLPCLGLCEHNDYDDLHSEGTIALIVSVDKFDPDYGVPFDAFAAIRIAHRLRTYARDNASLGSRRAGISELSGQDEDFGFVSDFADDVTCRQAIQNALSVALQKVEECLSTQRDMAAWTRQRRALEMRFGQNASLLAIGLDLGISPEAAQKVLNRAFDRLRPHLAPLLDPEL